MTVKNGQVLQFGEFELALVPLELRRHGARVPLQAQPLRLLALLATRAGEVVTHREIHVELWNDRIVNFSGSVHVCVRQLRTALDDDSAHPRYVETMPRRGYRFVALVASPVAPATSLPTRAASAQRRGWQAALVAACATLALLIAAVPGYMSRSPEAAGSGDDQARDAYLRGEYLMQQRGRENTRRSVRYFLDALEAQQDFVPAHIALARAYRELGAREESRRHAARALGLAPGSAEAHVQMATNLMHYEWRWTDAGRHVDRALVLDPKSADAHHIAATRFALLNDFPAALTAMDRAHRLDPVSTLLRADYGWLLYYAGRYDAAIARCREALELDARHGGALACLERAAQAKGDHAIARHAALGLMAAWGARELDRSRLAKLPDADAVQAFHAWRLQFFSTYPDQTLISPDEMADANVALGRYGTALELLERAAQARSPLLPFALIDPMFAPLRGNARFAALQARVLGPVRACASVPCPLS